MTPSQIKMIEQAFALARERYAELGVDVLAGVTIALLTVNIRNAWDLMLSFARRSAEESRAADDTG